MEYAFKCVLTHDYMGEGTKEFIRELGVGSYIEFQGGSTLRLEGQDLVLTTKKGLITKCTPLNILDYKTNPQFTGEFGGPECENCKKYDSCLDLVGLISRSYIQPQKGK
jgi:hypothetical protein